MTAHLDINGKKLLPIKEAVSLVEYSRDYITRLAREGKIVATQIGRKWYVDVDSLKNYQAVAEAEQEIKKRQLSDERKRDLAIKAAKEKKRARLHRHVQRRTPAFVALVAIVAIGVGVGVLLESQARSGFSHLAQLANLKTTVTTPVPKAQPTLTVDSVRRQNDPNAVVPAFSPRVATRELEANSGILLLPDGESVTVESIADYFSDPVTVVIDEAGQSAVVRVDAAGKPIGEPIPFVSVPINAHSP